MLKRKTSVTDFQNIFCDLQQKGLAYNPGILAALFLAPVYYHGVACHDESTLDLTDDPASGEAARPLSPFLEHGLPVRPKPTQPCLRWSQWLARSPAYELVTRAFLPVCLFPAGKRKRLRKASSVALAPDFLVLSRNRRLVGEKQVGRHAPEPVADLEIQRFAIRLGVGFSQVWLLQPAEAAVRTDILAK
jgi:hypothetical protein